MELQQAHQSGDSDDEEETMRQSHIVTDEEEQQAEVVDAGVDTDDEEDIQNRFTDVEVDLETLIWETHEIAKYTTLCHTGFTKITKVCLPFPRSPLAFSQLICFCLETRRSLTASSN